MVGRRLMGILLGTTLGVVAGASGLLIYLVEKQRAEVNEKNLQTLTGYPLSVEVQESNRLSAVIRTDEGKYILCSRSFIGSGVAASDMGALIESEINDGDNESIGLKGWYHEDNTFEIKSVSANGYTLGK